MRKYLIKEHRNGETVEYGTLYYGDKAEKFSMHLNDLDLSKILSLFFYTMGKRGIRNVPEEFVQLWIDERVTPPNRQNIDEILSSIGETHYTQIAILEAAHGRCTHDKVYLERIE